MTYLESHTYSTAEAEFLKTYHICPPPLDKAAYPANVGCVCAELLFVAHQARLSMGILQARILERVAKPSSRGSSQPMAPTLQVDSLLSEPPRKPNITGLGSLSLLQGIFPT